MSLVPSSARSAEGFQLQGTLDWISLSKETVGFSVKLLSRLARGGVHPYTLVVAQFVGNNFQLSSQGRSNFEAAVKEPRTFGTLDELVRFGFGVDSLPTQLSTTEQGMVCSALCAALSEFYHEDAAVEILLEMANLTELPDE